MGRNSFESTSNSGASSSRPLQSVNSSFAIHRERSEQIMLLWRFLEVPIFL
jgi:hypothetical protein